MSEKVTAMIEEIKALTVLELSELVHALEEEFGVSAAAMAAPAAAAAAPVEEKTDFDVVLASFDAAAKIKVIKVVRGSPAWASPRRRLSSRALPRPSRKACPRTTPRLSRSRSKRPAARSSSSNTILRLKLEILIAAAVLRASARLIQSSTRLTAL
jgi:hypothetical protein